MAGLVVAAYFATARLGLSLAFAHASVSAVWPPTGIALAAVLLGELKALGVRLVLDDFGTGYSSLRHLGARLAV